MLAAQAFRHFLKNILTILELHRSLKILGLLLLGLSKWTTVRAVACTLSCTRRKIGRHATMPKGPEWTG